MLRSLPALALLVACTPKADVSNVAPPPVPAAPKNLILIIGDGMGPQQVGMLELFARKSPSRPFGDTPTAFARMAEVGEVGLSLHDPHEFLVTDSACSATQLATGQPAPVEALGVDASGNRVQTVLEMAMARGMATGLVSDTRLTHATPAAFASHVPSRADENTIASQMLATGPDVMMSGGRRHFLPQSAEGSKRTDDRDLLQEARDAGYSVVTTRDELAAAGSKMLGLFATSGMADAITELNTRDRAGRTEPSLTQMAMAAIERLDDDEDGFFLMIESGQIDWAGHANDAGWLLHEMIRAEEMLVAVLDWVEANGDTLLVVTADHETGGFGLGYSRINRIEPRTLTGDVFGDTPFAPRNNYGDPRVLNQLAAQKATWGNLLRAFASQPEAQRTPESLMAILNEASAFDIDLQGAKRILASHPDPYGIAQGDVAHFMDFAAFYPTEDYGRTGLVAREVAAAQNVIWSTGGHTHTPVPVFAVGPQSERFDGLLHHTGIGQRLQDALFAE